MDKHQIYEQLNKCYFSEDCHEKDVLKSLPRLLKGVDTFVDVGASLGQYTKFVAQYEPAINIVAIEADPVRYEELERNARRWMTDYGSTINTVHGALSDKNGEITLYNTNSNVSGGVYEHDVKQEVEWEAITVPSLTLDSMFPNDPPGLVKVDIEGGEYKMLLGAASMLKKKKTIFLIELHGWKDSDGTVPRVEVVKIMANAGYRSVPFQGKTLFLPFGLSLFKENVVGLPRRLLRYLYRLIN